MKDKSGKFLLDQWQKIESWILHHALDNPKMLYSVIACNLDPTSKVINDVYNTVKYLDLKDCESDLCISRTIILKTERISKVIGSNTIISISMDLPGKISWRLAHLSDLITRHRLATH
jgi:hypothetical protein